MRSKNIIISIEDARRIFILTCKIVVVNTVRGTMQFKVTRNAERANFKDNEDDAVIIPTKDFNQALETAMKACGMHLEELETYRKFFADMDWILRGRDKKGAKIGEIATVRKIDGKRVRVYRIDKVKLDMLEHLDGLTALTEDGKPAEIPRRNVDGRVVYNGGVAEKTRMSVGRVPDSLYRNRMRALDARLNQPQPNTQG